MTVCSELFVAKRRDALRFSARRPSAASPEYVRTAGRGVLPDDLEALWAALLGEPVDPSRHQLENVRFGPSHPTGWRRLRRKVLILAAVVRSVMGGEGVDAGLYRLPPAFVRLLADLDDATLRTALPHWSAASSWASAAGDETGRLLDELRSLARHALASGRPLFLWGETLAGEAASGSD